MAMDKAVDSAVLDAGLTVIANAIREKGGTSGSLAFPDGMAAAIAAIEAGGGMPFYENILYTGEASYIDDGDGNYRVKFLTSGTLTVKNDIVVDIFAVGGGGNGGAGDADYYQPATDEVHGRAGGGGGGGYTTTAKVKALNAGNYIVTVGAAAGKSSLTNEDATVIYCTANGGKSGGSGSASGNTGGAGGSGGGGGGYSSTSGGNGGSDGSDGYKGSGTAGAGQDATTREFGEDTGDLYAGGGGGGAGRKTTATSTSYTKRGTGGSGGGGDGGNQSTKATAGGANTGGGGGGGAGITSYTTRGVGGTGIVIIRNTRVATG